MVGRRLLFDQGTSTVHRPDDSYARRRAILRETVEALTPPSARQRHHQRAQANLARWKQQRSDADGSGCEVWIEAGDWGEVTLDVTRARGELFAVLNMANAYVPGGGYVEGCPAQEENMFRRTDCHFSVTEAHMDPHTERYVSHMSALLNAQDGRVHLDVEHPRVCIRGTEDRDAEDLGYRWLADEEIFPFLELRAAAVDLRGGLAFDPDEMERRIRAQFVTLAAHDVRHVVLSAFGCGAFRNPAFEVARLYREVLEDVRRGLTCVVFAIFNPGYGPDNYTPFVEAFDGLSRRRL